MVMYNVAKVAKLLCRELEMCYTILQALSKDDCSAFVQFGVQLCCVSLSLKIEAAKRYLFYDHMPPLFWFMLMVC